MDEAEAEAVLRALGDGLEWEPFRGFTGLDNELKQLISSRKKMPPTKSSSLFLTWLLDQKNTIEAALVTGGYYSIRARRKLWCIPVYTTWFLPGNPYRLERDPKEFKSLSGAKLACERHHATGKWE